MTQQSGPPTPPAEQRSLGDQVRLAFAAIFGVALIIFFLQNLQEVEINFLFWDVRTAMIWALLVSAILGAASVFLVSTLLRWRRGRAQDRD